MSAVQPKRLVVAMSALFASSVSAIDVTSLDQVVVTATLTEQPVQDVNASVQVISSAELQTFSGRSASEALQSATGLLVRDLGSTSSIAIRGFDYAHTLVLVDGLRRTEKYAGSNVNNLPLENIERIEIVRGPMSALYGSEALGGVVNFITRVPKGAPQTDVKVTLGTAERNQRETAIVTASTAFATDTSSHRLGAELRHREPFRLDPDSVETDINEEQRGFLTYNGRLSLNDTDSLAFSAEYLNQDDSGTGLDRFNKPYERIEDEERYFLSGRYTGQIGKGTLSTVLAYGSSDATVNRGTVEDETTDFDQTQLDATYAIEPAQGHFLNVGAGFRLDEVSMNTMTTDVDREVYNVFAQDQWDVTDTVNLTAGVRFDHYSDFGNSTNPRAMLSWRPEGPWSFRIGYGTGFKAPTLLQLYMKDMVRGRYLIRGNPDLEPEESETFEAGIAYRLPKGRVELIVHDSELTNLIAAERTGRVINQLAETVYRNIGEASIQGVELVGSYHFTDATSGRLSVEYLDATDETADERLVDRPRWKSTLALSSQIAQVTVEGRLNYIGDFYASDPLVVGGPNYESDYATVDLYASYPVNSAVRLFAGIENLFDRDMPDNMAWRGQPSDPGARFYYAGVAARF